jgi:D-xylose transport system permease protein
MLASLLGAPLLWTAMGALIVKQRIPAFIITLGGLLVFKGLHWLVIRAETVPVVPGGETNLYSLLTTYYLPPVWGLLLGALVLLGMAFLRVRARRRRQRLGLTIDDNEVLFLKLFVTAQVIGALLLLTNQYRGLPLAGLIVGAVAVGVHVLTRHMPFGRYLYAIGGNEDAARLSGVPVDRVVIGAFASMGFVVALSGLLSTAYSGASTTTVGNLLELDAIAACVIGGTSLRGGRGSVLGVLFGSLIMATLLNGMTLLAVSPEVKFIARGVVLALAVWLDVRLNRGSA